MSAGVRALTVGTAVGCATVGGVFFAFSSFVMPAFARLAPAEGVAVMQAVNASAVRPVFMTALFGTGAGCVALTVTAMRRWGEDGSGQLLAGSLTYLVGALAVTAVRNVPLNEALAAVDVTASDAAARWQDFRAGWVPANHVRTVTSLVAAGLLAWAPGR